MYNIQQRFTVCVHIYAFYAFTAHLDHCESGG